LNSREAIVHAIAKGIGIGFVSAVEYAETPGTKPITFVDHLCRSPVFNRLPPVLPGYSQEPADDRGVVRLQPHTDHLIP
jgi:hypothetical protein